MKDAMNGSAPESKAEVSSAAKGDIDNIPYDAPLSIKPPTASWIRTQARKGNNSSKISTKQVPPTDLSGKWILITGGNNGIGREAALTFASWGANLLLGCRQPPPHEHSPDTVIEECKERAKANGHTSSEFEWWEVDYTDFKSVEAFTARWNTSGRPLDILCNNVGMGASPGGSAVVKTKDGNEILHQVNLLSHVLLTLGLLESLKRAKEPRVVCTTSCFHYLGKYDLRGFSGNPVDPKAGQAQPYQNNKLWFQVWLTELQSRLLRLPEYKHITVNGIHPGYVNSGIWKLSNAPIKTWLLQAFASLLAIDEKQGSWAIVNAATSLNAGPDPKVQGVGPEGGKGGGRYFNRIWEEEPMPHAKDLDCRLRVWRKVNDEIKLKEKGLLDVVGLLSTA